MEAVDADRMRPERVAICWATLRSYNCSPAKSQRKVKTLRMVAPRMQLFQLELGPHFNCASLLNQYCPIPPKQ